MTRCSASATAIDERDVRRILDQIKDPCSIAASVPMGLDEMGIVKSVQLHGDGRVDVELRLTSPFCEMIAYMRNEAIAKISQVPGVTGVSVTHDSGFDWDHDHIAPAAQARRQRRLDAMREIHLATSPSSTGGRST